MNLQSTYEINKARAEVGKEVGALPKLRRELPGDANEADAA